MRTIFLLAFLFFTIGKASLFAQAFPVEPIQINGPDEKRINLVILPDGYTASELDNFIVDANNFVTELFSQSPYQEYQEYFNVYAIRVPSNESGADHPDTAYDENTAVELTDIVNVDNYFGSTFDYFDIHRLLVASNTVAITNVLADNFPNYDQTLILVNSTEYGGSGGNFPTASLEYRSNEIAIHELGHSFAQLRDEYWAGDFYAQEGINMTQETDPNLVRWNNWIGDNGVDVYQYCTAPASSCATWNKPHQNCKMERLNRSFCSVCTEGTIEAIHELVEPIDNFYPADDTTVLISDEQIFQLQLIPTANLNISWELNGTIIANNTSLLTLQSSDLNSGENTLTVNVEDITPMLRVDAHENVHSYQINWTLEIATCPIDIYGNFDTADVDFADGDQCTAFPFGHFNPVWNTPFPWKATEYYAAYHVLLTENYWNEYGCTAIVNQGTETNIWMLGSSNPIDTSPAGNKSVLAFWAKRKHYETIHNGVYTQLNDLEIGQEYSITFYDSPVSTPGGRQTPNLYYKTNVTLEDSNGIQTQWEGPEAHYYNFSTTAPNTWYQRQMTFIATDTSMKLTLSFPLYPDPNNIVNDGYVAIDDIKINCVETSANNPESDINVASKDKASEKEQIAIYPNPTKDHLNIKLLDISDQIEALEIFNAHGHLVLKENGSNSINTSRLKKGIYFLKVKTSNNSFFTEKFIKL